MIIDVHGHYTTAPKALEAWRNRQIAGITDPSARPAAAELKISDDELRETIESNQLAQMKARGADLTIFSPRASFMAHHIGDSGTYIARYDDLLDGKDQRIDVSKVDVSMNGIELQDREFFAAIREGREPNASVAQVLPCYEVLDRLQKQLA